MLDKNLLLDFGLFFKQADDDSDIAAEDSIDDTVNGDEEEKDVNSEFSIEKREILEEILTEIEEEPDESAFNEVEEDPDDDAFVKDDVDDEDDDDVDLDIVDLDSDKIIITSLDDDDDDDEEKDDDDDEEDDDDDDDDDEDSLLDSDLSYDSFDSDDTVGFI